MISFLTSFIKEGLVWSKFFFVSGSSLKNRGFGMTRKLFSKIAVTFCYIKYSVFIF
jgi:hypothetical protein